MSAHGGAILIIFFPPFNHNLIKIELGGCGFFSIARARACDAAVIDSFIKAGLARAANDD